MGACAGQYNIVADQGATLSRNIHWKDENGAPIDVTGYSARMQVRQRFVSASPVISLTSPSGGITLGGSSGTIVVTASATVMAGVEAGDYVYDLEMVASNGVVTRLVQGSFKVRPEVTR